MKTLLDSVAKPQKKEEPIIIKPDPPKPVPQQFKVEIVKRSRLPDVFLLSLKAWGNKNAVHTVEDKFGGALIFDYNLPS